MLIGVQNYNIPYCKFNSVFALRGKEGLNIHNMGKIHSLFFFNTTIVGKIFGNF